MEHSLKVVSETTTQRNFALAAQELRLCDPSQMSRSELERLTRTYVARIHRFR